MLKPFYQGKLDAFCAIYAVLNALRLTHGIRSTRARDILNDTLLSLSTRPEAFRAFLTQETDYISLVDGMLALQSRYVPLEVVKPFATGDNPDPDTFWNTCLAWFGDQDPRVSRRTMVFRFLRHLKPEAAPLNRHWTTVDRMDKKSIHLFDCSHEAEAVLNIARGSFVTSRQKVDKDHLLHIQPESVRFLRLPC